MAEEGTEVVGNEIPNEGAPAGAEMEGGDPIEDRARSQGWMPYEEWIESGNNPDDWVGAEAFLVKGEFINKLKKQSKKMNEMEEVINELAEHHRKTAEVEYQRAWEDLKQQKAQALEEGDTQRAVEIDEEMNQTKEKYESQINQQKQKSQKQGNTNPEFEEWASKPENQWYFQDNILRSAADTLADQYVQSNPNASFQEVVSHVENQLAQELPNRFPKANSNKKKSSPVNEPQMSSSAGTKRSKKKVSASDMSEEQKQIGNKFVRQGAFSSLDEYAQELYNLGEIQK